MIVERIRAYERAGIGFLMFHLHPMMEWLERLAEQVMPLLSSKAMPLEEHIGL
ncbi:hypothetical protein [Undibacter mobilis]|uniref:hypothetical protein n=1 Tax=Undibacter mobilis TaxID=2292256 RepID=UPI00143D46CD|nr:hypothetical protein [Undibacter mobilis]